MASIVQELQDLIHTNLCLLRERGHIIEFQQGMFKDHNPPGFEKVGYALFMILDPDQCKKSIPWPLLDTKSHSEFRSKFTAFIKTLKTNYPDEDIPDAMPSTLQYPGGEKFLRLMYKLSTLTLKVELQRMIGPEQAKMLLPRMVPSKADKDNLVKYNIIRGAWVAEQIRGEEITDYVTKAAQVLEKLEEQEKYLELEINRVRSELEAEVGRLGVNDLMKQRLRDIDDSEAMAEWNARSQQKQKELLSRVQRLRTHRDHTVRTSEQLKAIATMKQQERVCLDGCKLKITSELDKLSGTTVISSEGRVRLESLFKAGLACAQSLRSKAPPPDSQEAPLLPQAQALLADSITREKKCAEYHHTIDTMTAECITANSQLRLIIYDRMRLIKAPDYLKYLRERPIPQHLFDSLSNKKPTTPRKRRSSFVRNILTVQAPRSSTFLCSFKRRAPAAHRMMTPMCGRSQVPSFTPFTNYKMPSTTVRGLITNRQNHMHTQVQAALTVRGSAPDETPAAVISKLRGSRRVPATAVAGRSSFKQASAEIVTGPSCFRRSLFKSLPTGPRTKDKENMAPFPDVVPNSATDVTPAVNAGAPVESRSSLSSSKRRSLDEIIQRYIHLKQSMAKKSND